MSRSMLQGLMYKHEAGQRLRGGGAKVVPQVA